MNSDSPPILQKIELLTDDHKYESAGPLIDEAIRTARQEQDFQLYCHVLFAACNSCFATEQIQKQLHWSIEAITLLEDLAHARKIDPTLDNEEFHWIRTHYLPDSYHNLALATAKKRGYNSEGMQEAVTQGIQKCRELGALEDIKYFQEFDLDISIAKNKLDHAETQARQLTQRSKDESDDRRCVGWEALGRILLLSGDLEGALNAFQEGLKANMDNPDPRDVGTALHQFIQMTFILLGEEHKYQDYAAAAPQFEPFILEEHRRYALLVDDVEACRACVAKDYEKAKALRQKAIDFAEETEALALWLPKRVQWLAVSLIENPKANIDERLEETAKVARAQRDRLTLRQLSLLRDSKYALNPLVSVRAFLKGPFAQSDS